MQLQKESAGIAAAAAKAQKDYNDAKLLDQDLTRQRETFKTMVENDPTVILNAMKNLLQWPQEPTSISSNT